MNRSDDTADARAAADAINCVPPRGATTETAFDRTLAAALRAPAAQKHLPDATAFAERLAGGTRCRASSSALGRNKLRPSREGRNLLRPHPPRLWWRIAACFVTAATVAGAAYTAARTATKDGGRPATVARIPASEREQGVRTEHACNLQPGSETEEHMSMTRDAKGRDAIYCVPDRPGRNKLRPSQGTVATREDRPGRNKLRPSQGTVATRAPLPGGTQFIASTPSRAPGGTQFIASASKAAALAAALGTAAVVAPAQTSAASADAPAHTGTVTATLAADAKTFNVSFANHANETNSLWVVYGANDMGGGTNGWTHVERLGTVYPDTATWTYAVPDGWGDTVKAVRFVLSEVPYDYDYSTTYTAANQVPAGSAPAFSQCLRIDNDADFTMNAAYTVRVKFALNKISNKHNYGIFRAASSTPDDPFLALFWMQTATTTSPSQFRFDYRKAGAYTRDAGYTDPDEVFEVEGSAAGLYRIGTDGAKTLLQASPNKTVSTAATSGPLLLFAGKADAVSNPSCARIYACCVTSAANGDGDVLLNLVPMVKDGRAGMYDTVHGKAYFAALDKNVFRELDAGERVENENPFFASAVIKVTAEGEPTVFTPATATTDATDYTNASGGVLKGSATLTLSGRNDWGGTFTVSNGTLIAGFGAGQGLAATDRLVLAPQNALNGTYGGYGGWNGKATATFGDGAGQITIGGKSDTYMYYAWCAADGGSLEVDAGGAGAAIVPGAVSRFLFNGAAGAGTLRVKNPIAPTVNNFALILRNGYGRTYLDGAILSPDGTTSGDDATKGTTVNAYPVSDASDGVTLFASKDNRFKTYQQHLGGKGAYGLAEGAVMTLDGSFNLYNGTFAATNATLTLTGNAKYASNILVVTNATLSVKGGTVTAGGLAIGFAHEAVTPTAWQKANVTLAGTVRLTKVSSAATQAIVINGSAASSALTLEDGADVQAGNLYFYRRNVTHKGGALTLSGSVTQIGQQGTARYTLSGGTLTARGMDGVYAPEVKDENGATVSVKKMASFVFNGGTLVTARNVKTPFFDTFYGESEIAMYPAKGGTFQVDYATTITNGLATFGSGAWTYAPAAYLTAPAFKKTGTATLTLSGESTYLCATDVAEGVLKLAGGDAPGVLPPAGVVRLTGGTLDLGGNTQTVKALAGTAGSVLNGALTVTDGIYPGGHGAVGAFTCGAALSGTLYVEADAETGACDRIVAAGTLDLANLDLVLPATFPAAATKLRVVSGATTGAFRSVSNLPAGWDVFVKADHVTVNKLVGTTILIR